MQIVNTGAVLDGFGRDGRDFGHLIENTRDSMLNGAQSIEFRVHGFDPEKRWTPPRAEEGLCEPVVLRRVIADDGNGMDLDTLMNVYHNFSVTGTDLDFDVAVDSDANVSVSTEPKTHYTGEHARRGIGGRSALAMWNPCGVVTITVRDGVALMTHMYRDLDNVPRMREWFDTETGVKKSAIEPYTELDFLSKQDLIADRDFAEMLLVTAKMVSTATEASEFVAAMGDDEAIVNPFAGVAWDDDVVPDWIIDGYDEHGYARRRDGELAHGTVKVLLGRDPYDSTAITGDPNFPTEADYSKYNGAGNRFFFDLNAWNVRIQAVWQPKDVTRLLPIRHLYKVVGHDGVWTTEQGDTQKSTRPSGRRQLGAFGVRDRDVTRGGGSGAVEPEPEESESNESDESAPSGAAAVKPTQKWLLNLGRYGQAILMLRGEISKSEAWATSTKSVIGVVYGNEMHFVASESGKTPDHVYNGLAMPTTPEVKGRVSLFLMLPEQAPGMEGVFQTSARDQLKWSGMNGLPLTGDDGIYSAVRAAYPQEFRDFLESGYDNDVEIEMDDKLLRSLVKTVISSSDAGKLWASETAKRKAEKRSRTTDDPALLEDGSPDADQPGKRLGVHGKPGPTERPVCDLCGRKVHAEGCPNKPEAREGGRGGTRGKVFKLTPDVDGKRHGRASRAKIVVAEPIPPEPILPEPPNIMPVTEPSWDRSDMPMAYDLPPDGFLPATGNIRINENHELVRRLYGLGRSVGRDETHTELAVRRWIKQRLIETLFSILLTHDTQLIPEEPTRYSLNDLGLQLSQVPEFWFGVISSWSLTHRESLKAYVRANAPAKIRSKAKIVDPDPDAAGEVA